MLRTNVVLHAINGVTLMLGTAVHHHAMARQPLLALNIPQLCFGDTLANYTTNIISDNSGKWC